MRPFTMFMHPGWQGTTRRVPIVPTQADGVGLLSSFRLSSHFLCHFVFDLPGSLRGILASVEVLLFLPATSSPLLPCAPCSPAFMSRRLLRVKWSRTFQAPSTVEACAIASCGVMAFPRAPLAIQVNAGAWIWSCQNLSSLGTILKTASHGSLSS